MYCKYVGIVERRETVHTTLHFAIRLVDSRVVTLSASDEFAEAPLVRIGDCVMWGVHGQQLQYLKIVF